MLYISDWRNIYRQLTALYNCSWSTDSLNVLPSIFLRNLRPRKRLLASENIRYVAFFKSLDYCIDMSWQIFCKNFTNYHKTLPHQFLQICKNYRKCPAIFLEIIAPNSLYVNNICLSLIHPNQFHIQKILKRICLFDHSNLRMVYSFLRTIIRIDATNIRNFFLVQKEVLIASQRSKHIVGSENCEKTHDTASLLRRAKHRTQ